MLNDIQPLATIIFTIFGGIAALILGSKTRFPSILFLLGAGILLGPHCLELVQPSLFNDQFPQFISVLVALILFQGATSLKVSQFHAISGALKRLLTIGAAVTLVTTTFFAHWIAHFSWIKSILFGAIMIVTGPTVILPILKRIRVKEHLHNLLKWEAILIDPLGVITAVILFEIFLVGDVSLVQGCLLFIARITVGLVVGLMAGMFIHGMLSRNSLLRFEGEELGGLFVIAAVLFSYGIAEWIMPESGLVMATAAGIFIGNRPFPHHKEVCHFSERLTLVALSCLFILLSGNLPIQLVPLFYKEGLTLLAVMIFVVRPLSVFVSTARDTTLSLKDKIFISFLAPRGIVSASLASLFAIAFEEKALTEHGTFLPLAFEVIAGSIIFYAFFSGFLVKKLNVQEERGRGVIIVGAQTIGLFIGAALRSRQVPVQFVDTNTYLCAKAREKGFVTHTGSGFNPHFIESLDLKGIISMLALTPNREVNNLCCQTFTHHLGPQNVFRLHDPADNRIADDEMLSTLWGDPVFSFIAQLKPGIYAYMDGKDYELFDVAITSPTLITPEMSASLGGHPLFGITRNGVVFLTTQSILPPGSTLVCVKFHALVPSE